MSLEDIKETFSLFADWEDKYRYIIELGKDIPELSDKDKTDSNLIRGCQSQVWLVCEISSDKHLQLHIDSDAHIVRGLIAIVLASLNNRAASQILEFDVESLFEELELMEHLSPTRGNGLRSMVGHIKSVAEAEISS